LERYSIFLKSLSVSPFCACGMLLMISSCSALALARTSGFSCRKTVAHMVMWLEDSWPAHDEDVDDLVVLRLDQPVPAATGTHPKLHCISSGHLVVQLRWCIVARSGRTEKEAFIPMDTRTATMTFTMSL
jgi:hypothetical protein